MKSFLIAMVVHGFLVMLGSTISYWLGNSEPFASGVGLSTALLWFLYWKDGSPKRLMMTDQKTPICRGCPHSFDTHLQYDPSTGSYELHGERVTNCGLGKCNSEGCLCPDFHE